VATSAHSGERPRGRGVPCEEQHARGLAVQPVYEADRLGALLNPLPLLALRTFTP
jgi:hypothetical protein